MVNKVIVICKQTLESPIRVATIVAYQQEEEYQAKEWENTQVIEVKSKQGNYIGFDIETFNQYFAKKEK